MKNKKLFRFIIALCIFGLIFPAQCFGAEIEETEYNGEYDYILNTFEENAYVIFGDETIENKSEFIDGLEQGIEDTAHVLWNEKTVEKGMDGRKFYKGNDASIKIDKDFYEEGDREFLVSVAYYDYGPSEGRFHFDYFNSESDEAQRITLIKSGKIQDWFVKTFYIDDMDLSKEFETGANVELVTGAWNLFKKIEIVNISKLKRDKQAARATLASSKRDSLITMGILTGNETEFVDKNLNLSCSSYNVNMLLNIITGKNEDLSKYAKDDTITQGDLLRLYGGAVGVEFKDENICDYAKEIGLVYDEDLFFAEDANATNYNLLALANNTLVFTREDQSSLATDLLKSGFLNSRAVCLSGEQKLIAAVFRTPQPCPYEVVLDNETGQQFYNMTIYGLPTMRPYVTTQSWTEDGKRFLCSLMDGTMFLYHIEDQTLTYIDMSITEEQRLHATVGTDDYIYYAKKDNGEYSMWRVDANAEDMVQEFITQAPPLSRIAGPQISNDCNYISADYTDNALEFSEPGERTFARYSIKDDKWEIYTHTFDYGNVLTHAQVNPQYPDTMAFSHEVNGAGLSSMYELYDRMWVFDCNTKEAKCIYEQGRNDTDGLVVQGATHEIWSNDGQYMYFINYSMDSQRNVGKTPSAVRFNADGSHRQYYFNEKCYEYQYQHCYATTDNKYIVADGGYLVLINTETNQHFPISHFVWNMGKSHPYQAHPVIARNRYIVSWGASDDEGILGVRWFDFTQLAAQSAQGGREQAGENVEAVSYRGLDCYSEKTTKNGRECFFVKKGNELYLDISESVADTIDGSVKISFDYLENGYQPITITYTSGVKYDDQRWRVFDKVKNVPRRGTNGWKHCEFVIESGNFENIGTYSTDIKLGGVCSNFYIANINVQPVQ